MAYIGSNPRLKSIVSTGAAKTTLDGEDRVAGRLVYATDDKLFYYDDGSTLTAVGAGGGGSSSVTFTRNQTTHGFAVLDPIYHDGANWVDARADDSGKLASHVVTEVTDADNFVAAKFGEFTATAHGLTVGQHYFLGDTGGKQLTSGTSYSCPLLYVEDANTVFLEVLRPSAVGGTGLTLSYEIIVGNNQDVIDGAASYSSIAAALAVASDGNIIRLLPRTFVENVSITDKLLLIGYGNESVIQGTLDFDTGSDKSKMEGIKVDGNVTVNTNNGIYTSSWLSTGSTFTDNGTNNVVRDIIIEV